MARIRQVTRTIEVTEVEVMCLNTTTCKVSIKTFEVTGKHDNAKALEKVRKLHETSEFKCVAVQSNVTKEVLYGMLEEDFIKLAKVLPPRTGNNEQD